jgi:autotransporter-associated beta strand protein
MSLRPHLRLLPAAVAVCILCAAPALHSQIVWTGASSNTWLDSANWTGGDGIPNANTEIARFNAVSVNAAPVLGSATTIGNLQFLIGAGSHSLSGSALTVQNSTGNWIEHSAGNLQTISNNVVLNATAGTGRTVSVAAGSTLSFGGSLSATSTGATDTNINLSNAGIVNLGGSFAGNQLQQSSTGTLNINSSQNAGSYISNNNSGRINWNANLTNSRSVGLGNSASGSGRSFITTSGVSLAQVNFRGGNNSVNTLGADIGGAGGMGSVANVSIENATRTNATHIFAAAADNVLNITGVVSGAAGSGTTFRVDGAGAVRFSGTTANTSPVPISISSGGRLELNKTDGINAFAGTLATINSGAELRLLNNNQIANTSNITVSGGTLGLQTFSDTVANVTMTSGSITGSGTLTGSAFALESGSISANLAGAGNVTKTTAGTVLMTGASSYSGTTDVNAGVFEANNTTGSATGLGTTTIANGATLAGHGRAEAGTNNFIIVNGTLQIGATADTAGSNFGLATFGSGSAMLGSASSTLVDLWSTTGTDQTANQAAADTLRLFGALDISSGATLKLNNPNALSFMSGDMFRVIDWTGLTTLTGAWSTIDSSALALGGGLTLDTSNLYSSGVVSIVGVPEPSRAVLLLLGLLGLVTRRRR